MAPLPVPGGSDSTAMQSSPKPPCTQTDERGSRGAHRAWGPEGKLNIQKLRKSTSPRALLVGPVSRFGTL